MRERGEPGGNSDDPPDLVRKAQLALAVHPTAASPGPDSSEAVKKILGA